MGVWENVWYGKGVEERCGEDRVLYIWSQVKSSQVRSYVDAGPCHCSDIVTAGGAEDRRGD